MPSQTLTSCERFDFPEYLLPKAKSGSISALLQPSPSPASAPKPKARRKTVRKPAAAVPPPMPLTTANGQVLTREQRYTPPPKAKAAVVQNIPITLPTMYPWQERVWAALHDPVIRFVVVAKGQQIGGSLLGGLWLVEGGLQAEDSWWVAPDFTLSEVGYDILTEIYSHPPFTEIVKEEKKRLRFVTTNAGRTGWIQIRSADDPNKLISRTLDREVVDEFAIMSPDAWEGKLSERLTLRRGKALIIFNPRGKNHAWDLWRRGDPDNPARDPEWMSFQFSQYDNPTIPRADIEKKRLTYTRSRFQSEVMGQFVDSGGEVFVNVRDQSRIGVVNGTVQPDPSHLYVGGLDISGGRHDWHVLMIEDVTLRMQVAMIRFSTQELSVMTRTFLDAQIAWNLQGIDGDETTIGIFPMREFQNAGIHIRPVNLNSVSKRLLIEDYAAEIELRKIRLLNDSLVVLEHEAYQAEETATGYIRYNSPKGGTDDTVIAGALAHRAATVHDSVAQPSVVRAQVTGLYDRTEPRAYPGWGGTPSAAAPLISGVRGVSFPPRLQHRNRPARAQRPKGQG